jgi:uncharacterized protein DUF664
METIHSDRPPDLTPADDELPMLRAYFDRQRATFAWKTGGLDQAQLRATLAGSRMTLAGMLKHLARFEDDMTHEWILGQGQIPPWSEVDWDADPEWDWRTGAADPPDALYRGWQEAVARSRSVLERLATANVDAKTVRGLRFVLLNMIEEYARHNGHADLIRESIDGLVGHDPPA